MNGRLRLVLCGACVAIGAFHAPWATHVLAEDLAGTYAFVAHAEPRLPYEARFAAAKVRSKSEEFDVPRAFRSTARITSNRR